MITGAPKGDDGRTGLAFQEYSPEFPHAKGTVGWAGRPSGPAFYISLIDNTKNHGPGSQQKGNPYEADSAIGKIVEGWDDVVPRMKHQPGASGGNSFVKGDQNHIRIERMTITHN